MASSSPYIDVQGVKLLASRILYVHPLVSDIVIDRQHLLAFRVDVPLELLRILPQPGGSVRGERANFRRLVLGCIEARKQANRYVRSFSEKKRKPKYPRALPNFASKYSLESSRRDLHNALLCTVYRSRGIRLGEEIYENKL